MLNITFNVSHFYVLHNLSRNVTTHVTGSGSADANKLCKYQQTLPLLPKEDQVEWYKVQTYLLPSLVHSVVEHGSPSAGWRKVEVKSWRMAKNSQYKQNTVDGEEHHSYAIAVTESNRF